MKLRGRALRNLASIRLNEYPKHNNAGRYFAQVVKVYDGDTITIVMRERDGAPYFQYNVRMYGYDSPELRPPKNTRDRARIVESAKSARDYLQKLIFGKPVLVEVLPDADKYGRLLCKVYARPGIADAIRSGKKVRESEFTLYVNDAMIERGHGYAYYGGTKR
jgi:endonuclease YncB( thermonuclease family)